MKIVDDSMKALTDNVLSEAQAEAEQLLEEARKKADGIRQHAQEQAEVERKGIVDQASREADRVRSQAVSTAQLNARTMQLESREELLTGVIDKARKQLNTIQQWTDYDQIAKHLLQEALVHLRANEVQVHADPATQNLLTGKVLDDLSKELNIKIQMGKPLDHGVGVLAETLDGRRQFDNTLETRLNRMQNELRSLAYHTLMGEQQ